MRMQMDACLKTERIGTLFDWVGALEGGLGGGGPSGVSTSKSNVSSKRHNSLLQQTNKSTQVRAHLALQALLFRHQRLQGSHTL